MASGCWPRAPLRFNQLNMVAARYPLGSPAEGDAQGESCLREKERVLMEDCLVEEEEEKGGSWKVDWGEEMVECAEGEQRAGMVGGRR